MPSARVSSFVDSPEDAVVLGAVIPHETTCYHDAIFRWFREGGDARHLVVEALAGTGKTTTILRAIDEAPEESIWLATFGKRNQEELDDRVTNPNATAQTIHSAGAQAVRNGPWGYVRMCQRFEREDALAEAVCTGASWGAKRLVSKLHTKARELMPLVGTPRFGTMQESIDAVCDLAFDFDLAPPAGESLTVQEVAQRTLRALDLAAREKPVKTGIDFADQLFLPVRNEWLVPRYDLVVVDEYQDLTLAQLAIIRGLLFDYGRIVFVGDKHQAIYRFRGADGKEVERTKAELRAETLTLPKTYRCPRAVVAVAREYVPEYQVDDSAPLGVVDTIDADKLVQEAQPGDFILSRTNKDLTPIAFALLRADKPATIRGRDIAKGLVNLVKKLATGDARDSIPVLLTKLQRWENKEIDRLLAMKREDKVDAVEDKAETLRVLAMGSTGVPHLLERIDKLFTDAPNGGIILSTVHKAKGLEAERVFLLKRTFFRMGGCTCGHYHRKPACPKCSCTAFTPDPAHMTEEKNIYYVAVTRSKNHLTMVQG